MAISKQEIGHTPVLCFVLCVSEGCVGSLVLCFVQYEVLCVLCSMKCCVFCVLCSVKFVLVQLEVCCKLCAVCSVFCVVWSVYLQCVV